jgi:TRAP-type C4-dicarboxylate transport system permease small subunit
MPTFLRSTLDRLYALSGATAATFLIAMLILIVLQMLARWTGEVFPGAPDYAGYCMAAASFFGFSYALNRGAHIRVSILLNSVGEKSAKFLNLWCFGIATALAWYLCFYAYRMVYWSWKFNDISQGQDATPLWIPQLSVLIGGIIFAIALTDHLVHLLLVGKDRIASEKVAERNQDSSDQHLPNSEAGDQ